MSSHNPSPGPSSQTVSTKTKSKTHNAIGSGIAAGAEDAKYQAKYKDLKRKVKDVETENDMLQFKVLQAKRSIQRMKLERAILYERLSGTPQNVPDVRDRHAPPVLQHHSGPGGSGIPPSNRAFPAHQDIAEHRPMIDIDRSIPENSIPRERHRGMAAPEGRSAPVMDSLTQGAGLPSPHLRSPPVQHHTTRQSGRHGPPPLVQQHLPPVPNLSEPSPRSSRAHVSPVMHHAHLNSSHERHERSGSHSTRHRTRHSSGQSYYQGPPQYPEDIPIPPQHAMHSPPPVERERTRHHHDEYPPSQGNGRHSGYISHNSPPMHASDVRSSSHRPHNHQRVGPASYINRDEPMYDRQRDLEREREWERERELRDRERNREYSRSGRDLAGSQILTSPQAPHRVRQSSDRGDIHHPEHGLPSSHIREEQATFYRDAPPVPSGYPLQSRSGSPGSSGSGIGANEIPSRPASRGHYYEAHERSGSYRIRPTSNHPSEEVERDYSREEPRSVRDHSGGGNGFVAPDPNYPLPESRKRGRNDMEVDSDDAGDGEPLRYPGGRKHHYDRGSKRYQREHLRSLDDPEDARAGPP